MIRFGIDSTELAAHIPGRAALVTAPSGRSADNRSSIDVLKEVCDLRLLLAPEHGVRGVTYMPTRNTPAQLARIRELAERHGFIQVSGEDINSPCQSFVIKAMENPMFSNLIDATWKLIGHEKTGSAIC